MKKLLCMMLIIAISIIACACGATENRVKDLSNILTDVIQSPDFKQVELMLQDDNYINIQEENKEQKLSQYRELLDEMYKCYFTENGYKSFLNLNYPERYHMHCAATEQEVSVKSVKVSVDKNRSEKMNFVVISKCGKIGSKKREVKSTGYAVYTKDEKIDILVLDGQLLYELEKIPLDVDKLEKYMS